MPGPTGFLNPGGTVNDPQVLPMAPSGSTPPAVTSQNVPIPPYLNVAPTPGMPLPSGNPMPETTTFPPSFTNVPAPAENPTVRMGAFASAGTMVAPAPSPPSFTSPPAGTPPSGNALPSGQSNLNLLDSAPAAPQQAPATTSSFWDFLMNWSSEDENAYEPVSITDEPELEMPPVGSMCGNGVVDPGEQCDGTNLQSQNCISIPGFRGYQLRCGATCQFDTSLCIRCSDPQCLCGNNRIDPGEECEGTGYTGVTCRMKGFPDSAYAGSDLHCRNCRVDISDCTNLCGNGVIDPGEQCDRLSLNGKTCWSPGVGFLGGTLRCNTSCQLDTSRCSNDVCTTSGNCVWSRQSCCAGYRCGLYGTCRACEAGENCPPPPACIARSQACYVGAGYTPCCAGLRCEEYGTNGSAWCVPEDNPPPPRPESCNAVGQNCCAGNRCDGGLQCIAGTCHDPPPPPPTSCDTAGSPCCTNPPNSCSSDRLRCVNGTCVGCGDATQRCCTSGLQCNNQSLRCVTNPSEFSGNPTCISCGQVGELCCNAPAPAPQCGARMNCLPALVGENRCRACGVAGGDCCAVPPNATACNDTGYVCRAATLGESHTCRPPCGNEVGQTCCPGNSCNAANLACNRTTQQCVTCGGSGNQCCDIGTRCATNTNPRLSCDTSTNTCQACGNATGPCCAGSSCNSNTLACVVDTCVACGQQNQPCCSRGTGCGTNTGLICDYYRYGLPGRCIYPPAPPSVCEYRSQRDGATGGCAATLNTVLTTYYGDPGRTRVPPNPSPSVACGACTNDPNGGFLSINGQMWWRSCRCQPPPSSPPMDCANGGQQDSIDVAMCARHANCPQGQICRGSVKWRWTWSWGVPTIHDDVVCACRPTPTPCQGTVAQCPANGTCPTNSMCGVGFQNPGNNTPSCCCVRDGSKLCIGAQ